MRMHRQNFLLLCNVIINVFFNAHARDSPSINHCLPLSFHAEDRGYGQELFDKIPERGTISF